MEEVLLAVGKQVGRGNLSFALHMNKTVVVFLKDGRHVHEIKSGVFLFFFYQGCVCLGVHAVNTVHAHRHLRCPIVYS